MQPSKSSSSLPRLFLAAAVAVAALTAYSTGLDMGFDVSISPDTPLQLPPDVDLTPPPMPDRPLPPIEKIPDPPKYQGAEMIEKLITRARAALRF